MPWGQSPAAIEREDAAREGRAREGFGREGGQLVREPCHQLGTGSGDSDLPNIPAEFTPTPYKVGSVGMARSQSPNSANSQFFICFEGCGSLTGQYTLFGEVVSGMDAVRKIKKGSSANNGSVSGPDKIIRMRLLADAK